MTLQQNTLNGYTLKLLNKELAQQYATEFASLADLIPQVTYSENEILAESKDARVFYGKWEHSLALFDEDKPIALIIGYERKKENNDQYPQNTLYISELAVQKDYQRKGIAKKLLQSFFDYNNKVGLKHLGGKINYSLQTNSVSWNNHVRDLYKSFGFMQRATKNYVNRVDVILGMEPKL